MTVYNGVLVIHFSAAMLLTAISFTGNLVTGFPTVFTVDLCRVKVLTHLSLLLVFIWLGGVRGGSRDKNSHTSTLQLRNSLISCFLHERHGFGNAPFVHKLSVLLTTFSDTVTTKARATSSQCGITSISGDNP